MPKNVSRSAVMEPAVAPGSESNRLTLPVVLGLAVFPVIAAVLASTGMPTTEIIPLLGYSTGIGVLAVLVLSGGRRLVAGLAALVLRASQQ
ncbi:hypothetical protein ACFY9F_36085 [Streptomyces sp. NPDC012421]|uniref:hypothetical protein n=1 Tax=Streptomyces sp. NPDC012421 TaxID=3364832 RepID=UPI0036EFE331